MIHVIWEPMVISLVHVLRASPARIRMRAVSLNVSYARKIHGVQQQRAHLKHSVGHAVNLLRIPQQVANEEYPTQPRDASVEELSGTETVWVSIK